MDRSKEWGTVAPYVDPERADKVLFEFIELCTKKNIEVYIIYGTVLGFYRDGCYIKGDDDIDVFIKSTDKERGDLVKAMKEEGYLINTIPGACRSMNMHTIKNKVFIDMWFNQRRSHVEYYKGFSFIEYKGKKVRIPDKIEEYLELVYGDWRVPGSKKACCFGK